MAADWQYSDNAITATSSASVSVSLGLKSKYLLITNASTSTGVCVEFDGASATTSASYIVLSTAPLNITNIPISSFVVKGASGAATVKVLALGQAISS